MGKAHLGDESGASGGGDLKKRKNEEFHWWKRLQKCGPKNGNKKG